MRSPSGLRPPPIARVGNEARRPRGPDLARGLRQAATRARYPITPSQTRSMSGRIEALRAGGQQTPADSPAGRVSAWSKTLLWSEPIRWTSGSFPRVNRMRAPGPRQAHRAYSMDLTVCSYRLPRMRDDGYRPRGFVGPLRLLLLVISRNCGTPLVLPALTRSIAVRAAEGKVARPDGPSSVPSGAHETRGHHPRLLHEEATNHARTPDTGAR
jgi:hypothetical protein